MESHVKSTSDSQLERVLHDATGNLSPAYVAALVAHPNAVRSALAAVADVLSSEHRRRSHEGEGDTETITGEIERQVNADEAESRLSKQSQAGRTENLVTSEQLAARVGFKTRQSVHNWLRKDRIVGWRGAKRGYVFPMEQFDERGRPLKGLDRVLPLFEDGYAAWAWLTTPRPSLDDAKPLTLLVRGEGDRVVTAAKGDNQGDFA